MKLIKGVMILLSVVVGSLEAHPTYLGIRYSKRARLSKNSLLSSARKPTTQKQSPLTALIYKLNHKK